MTSKSIKHWFAVDVAVQTVATEAVESAFNSLDALGTEINNLRKDNPTELVVTAYFNEPREIADIRDEINESVVLIFFFDFSLH